MHRLIMVGSPRPEGRSAALADAIFNLCIEEYPDDGVSILSVASLTLEGCRACDYCRAQASEGPEPLKEGDPLTPCALVQASDAAIHRCVIADDMDEVRKHLDAADELIVVSPVYFAGAPSQFKALLDRLQPYFWSNLREQPFRRPALLHVVGEGGDPHGFEPLVGTVQSALAVAGFQVETVLDWVGKIDEHGEITAEADVYEVAVAEEEQEGDSEEELVAEDPSQVEVSFRDEGVVAEKPRLDLGKPSKGSRTSQKGSGGKAETSASGNVRGGRAAGKGTSRSAGKSPAGSAQRSGKKSSESKRSTSGSGRSGERGSGRKSSSGKRNHRG